MTSENSEVLHILASPPDKRSNEVCFVFSQLMSTISLLYFFNQFFFLHMHMKTAKLLELFRVLLNTASFSHFGFFYACRIKSLKYLIFQFFCYMFFIFYVLNCFTLCLANIRAL